MTRVRLIGLVTAGVLVVGALIFGVLRFGGDDGPGKSRSLATEAAGKRSQDPVEEVPPDTAPSQPPTVEPYATKLSGKVETAKPVSPKDNSVKPLPRNYDGCDHNYGKIGQCIPWVFPAGVTTKKDKCLWLAGVGLPNPPVGGADRHGLDPDKNKIACDD